MTPGAGTGSGRAAAPAGRQPGVLHIRFRAADGTPPSAGCFEQLLRLLAQFTPVIEVLPPDAALADVRGALRYFDRDAAGLAELVRLRAGLARRTVHDRDRRQPAARPDGGPGSGPGRDQGRPR